MNVSRVEVAKDAKESDKPAPKTADDEGNIPCHKSEQPQYSFRGIINEVSSPVKFLF